MPDKMGYGMSGMKGMDMSTGAGVGSMGYMNTGNGIAVGDMHGIMDASKMGTGDRSDSMHMGSMTMKYDIKTNEKDRVMAGPTPMPKEKKMMG